MTQPRFSKFTFIVAILFVCATIPAFAQRGGGSHGGGFHGGGGGGFHSGGGGFGGGMRGDRSSPPRMGAGYSRSIPSAPLRSGGGSLKRLGGNGYRSYSGPVNGSQHVGNSFSAPRGIADGRWHSFGGGTGNRGAVAPQSEARASGSAGGAWHVFGGNRTVGSGVTRSFSGQGHEVWENAPMARNVVPSSRSLSSIRGSFANSFAGNFGLRSNASLFASSRFAQGTTFGNRFFTNGFVGLDRTRRFGFPFNRFGRGFRRGCWNCGFGFGGFGWGPGWGWGFGWPWLGFWNWDPFYWDNLWWGWPGYGYYGYPAGYPYRFYPYYNGYSYSAPPDNYSNPDPSSQSAAGEAQSSPQTFSVANGAVPVLLYLKDGSVYSARDYWLSGGQLRYVLLSGREGAFDVDQLDMQRTVDENAKSGVQFVLKPDPNSFAPASGNGAAPLDHTGSGNPDAKPSNPNEAPPAKSPDSAPQINLTSGPQVRS